MTAQDLLRPRYVIGTITILMMGALMYFETVGSGEGIAVIVGILAALGIYSKVRSR